jgi:Zn-dependent protease with chaperone function
MQAARDLALTDFAPWCDDVGVKVRIVSACFLLFAVLLCAWPLRALAQQPSESFAAASESFEQKLDAELERLDPTMLEPWQQANQARDSGDDERAQQLYSVVLDAQPSFDHALRRRCSVHMMRARWADALSDCSQAHELVPSVDNASALAAVLVEGPSSIRDPKRAQTLLATVIGGDELDATYLSACGSAMMLQDHLLLNRCVAKLRKARPDAWETYYFGALAHAIAGDVGDAQDDLDRAHELGLDDATYARVSAGIAESESPLRRYGRRSVQVVLLWIGLAVGLAAAGFALSRLTLAEAERALTNPAASADAKDSKLRKAYAWVLWLCCGYYYLSIPLVLVSVVALGAAIVLGFLYLGFIPIKLLAIIGFVVLGSVFAVLKSFFTRVPESEPGEPLDLDEAPGLRAVLNEVAAKVGTRPVDRVYLDVGTTIAVFERGGMLDKLRGKGERCLLLGVAVLDGLDTQAFQAILAHEYGHFSNEDTAGGNFALAVRRSVMKSAMGLAQAGVADWYNPSWLFLNGFHKLFLRISQGASRLQEVLADRWAARTYGADSFERGLRHVITAELRFDAHANAALTEVINTKQALRNIYEHKLTTPATNEIEVAAKLEELIHEQPSPYDSHPRPADRFRWAHAIARRESGEDRASEPSWGLFADRDEIEERMTDLIRDTVRAQNGIEIPSPAE